jgi:hypothetical protein
MGAPSAKLKFGQNVMASFSNRQKILCPPRFVIVKNFITFFKYRDFFPFLNHLQIHSPKLVDLAKESTQKREINILHFETGICPVTVEHIL